MKAQSFLRSMYELESSKTVEAFSRTQGPDPDKKAVTVSFKIKKDYGLLILGSGKRLGLCGTRGHEIRVILSPFEMPVSFSILSNDNNTEEIHSFSAFDMIKSYRLGEPIIFGE